VCSIDEATGVKIGPVREGQIKSGKGEEGKKVRA